MSNYPASTGPNLMRKSLEMQMSLLTTVSGNWMKASMQLSELNRQASRRLLEEAATDMQKALHIHTLPDAQAFLGEQSRSSLEKFRGYWQNVQAIAAQNWLPVDMQQGAATGDEQASKPLAALGEQSADGQRQEHDGAVHPSALVEKLIATAVADTQTRHT